MKTTRSISLFAVAVTMLVVSGIAEAQCDLSLPCANTASSTSTAFSVINNGTGRALEGRATSGIGVIGTSDNRAVVGVQGGGSCAGRYAVGACAATGDGILGRSPNRAVIGVQGGGSCAGRYAVGGCAATGDGILGRSPNRAVIGVQGGGSCAGRYAVGGCAATGDGILGRSPNRAVIGVQGGGSCAGSYGVGGCATTGDGVVGRSREGFAGRFEGRVLVQSLQITGGGDLAEPFNITGLESIRPGMLVSIDPAHPGQLRVTTKAYDRTLAGVVSGANGLNPGVTLRQADTVADGAIPVALTGRIYCLVDTSKGSIQPGDLLTSSDTPGHAMKATDYPRAHGAIIGKAMSSLETGRGLVLALVTLQ